MSEKINVLIVDDSISARLMLRDIVVSDPALSVIGMAANAFEAVDMLHKVKPDVILLDLEMPRMDGITFIQKIMSQHPLPIVVCSGHVHAGSQAAMQALSAGAVEVILKPVLSNEQAKREAGVAICDAIRAAFSAKNRGRRITAAPVAAAPQGDKFSPDEILPPPTMGKIVPKSDPLVVIGASTGGTIALEKIILSLPADCPPILIVQHMPKGFTAQFASRLDKQADLHVVEASEGLKLERGLCVIAEGDHHLVLRRMGPIYTCHNVAGVQVTRHRPSVDILFRSAALVAGKNAMGILLTGMGDDGARCLMEMRNAGSETIAQDEASCVVYGMPRRAVEIGAAKHVLPLDKMASAILQFDEWARRAGVR